MDPAKKLPMPKETSLRLAYFSPPDSESVPGIEDVITELQDKLDEVKRLQAKGKDAKVEQPLLGTMLLLRAWLTDALFTELMDVR